MNAEKLAARRLTRRHAKEMTEIESHKAQRPVKCLTISITWVKSRTWGSNPHAEATVEFHDGSFARRNGYTCSGCGYDKESTVIADIFNDFLRYKLYQPLTWKNKWKKDETHPYGVYYYGGQPGKQHESGYISKPSYEGGVGTSCYRDIGQFIGGKFETIASGKTFDVFRYVDEPKANA